MKKQLLFLGLAILFISPLFASAETTSISFDSDIKENYEVGETLSFRYEIEGDFSQDDKIYSVLIRQSDNKHFIFPSTNPQINASDSGLISGEINRTSGYYLTDGLYNLEIRLTKSSSAGGKDGAIVDKDTTEICIGGKCDNNDIDINASITSISDSPSPFVDGIAYNTDKIGVGIITKGGKDVYGGWVDVDKGNYWFLKVPRELSNGKYEIYLYLDNKEYDREVFEVTTNDDSGHYGKLGLSIKPDGLEDGDEMTIRFNDIGVDYYIVSAGCKDGIYVGGKARPDLCIEGEKVYGGGKSVITVDDFYPSSDRDTSFNVEVSAFEKDKVVKTDSKTVNIYDNFKPRNENKEEIVDNKPKEKLSKTQMLDLIANLVGKDSDVYKILFLLISLGIIK